MALFDFFKKKNVDKLDSNSSANKNFNFDYLSDEARRTNHNDELTALWKAMLMLEKWTFISKNNVPLENRQSFIGVVDNKPWVYVFTDSDKAKEFARTQENFIESDGSVFVIKSNTQDAIKMITNLGEKGVFGIRINEGSHGWFVPIETLPGIISYINSLK